jgi:hypothetical protein
MAVVNHPSASAYDYSMEGGFPGESSSPNGSGVSPFDGIIFIAA